MNKIKLAIAAAIIGIISLFFLNRYNQRNVTRISDLREGQMERIIGFVNSVYITKEGHAFLKVADDSGEVTVVAFNSSNIVEVNDLGMGDQISAFGRVEKYKGKLEVVAKEISKV
jgi:DNA polymerase II small subunit/DNA polymerase delta subunit B